MTLRFLFFAFIVFLLYRLIFHLIIPVYRSTSQIKKQFKDIQDKMQEQMKSSGYTGTGGENHPPHAPKKDAEVKKGDYLDYEEVK
jgi:hypothetical protein